MSAREVHVHIGRLVVDPPLRGQADGWADAIGRALGQHLSGTAAVDRLHPQAGLPGAIAHGIARQIAGATEGCTP